MLSEQAEHLIAEIFNQCTTEKDLEDAYTNIDQAVNILFGERLGELRNDDGDHS